MLIANQKFNKINPVWILSIPRSGSSMVVNFLNNTNLFHPKFREFNLDYEEKEQILKNLPKFIKLQRIFFEAKGFSDKVDKEKILKKFPNIRFIVTQRKNLYEQTVSRYFADYSKVWFIGNKKELEEYKKIKIPFNEKELIRLYNENLRHENCWDDFISDTKNIKLYYEDILKNKKNFLGKILHFLNLKVNLESAINEITSLKLQRKETEEYVCKLIKLIN